MSNDKNYQLFPKANEDIIITELYHYKKKENLYVIYSEKTDTYFYCFESNLKYCKRILELFNGYRSLDTIKELMSLEYPEISTTRLIDKLSKSSLIEGNKKSIQASEMSRTSIQIKEVSLNFFNKINRKLIDFLYFLVIFLFLTSIILIIYLIVKGVAFSNYILFANNNSYTLGLLISILFSLISVLFHELGHIISGIYNQIQPNKLGFSLYLNFIPRYYIKSKKIYVASRKNRILFHFGGPAIDFIIFAYLSMIAYLNDNSVCYFLAFASLQRFMLNLMPFGMSDGYYIMSVALKSVNLRINFINLISFKLSKVKTSLSYLLYYFVSLFYIVFTAYYTAFWIVGIYSDYFEVNNHIRIISFLISLILIFQLIIITSLKSKND